MLSYGVPVLRNHGASICLNDLLGLLSVVGAYKSQRGNLAARFIWFIMVSYGVSVLANREKSMDIKNLFCSLESIAGPPHGNKKQMLPADQGECCPGVWLAGSLDRCVA